MRTLLLAVALAFGLSGCADSEFVEHPITSLIPAWSDEAAPAQAAQGQPASDPQASEQPAAAARTAQTEPMQYRPAASDHCRNLAKLRSRDAAYSGEDESTQEAVYNRTYADCTAWDARHGS